MNTKAPMMALAAWLAGVVIAVLAAAPASAAVSLPPQFDDALVTQVDYPTAFDFTSDGRMLVASQYGEVHVYAGGQLLATPAIDLGPVACTNVERGVLGVAVDPGFATSHYVYLYYTYKKGSGCPVNGPGAAVGPDHPVNRVSRFALGDDNLIDPSSETILIDNIPSPNGGHNGGDLEFGPDGYLYVSTGDGDCDWLGDSGCQELNDAARDEHVLLGKLLRITANGDIPPDNPFHGADADRCNVAGQTTAGRKCMETFAWGLRNPYRFSFDPNATGSRFFINDVGQHTWEEIDEGLAGADYGWSVREGFCENSSSTECGPPPVGMTNPIYSYGRSEGCKSITGGAFVPNGLWPASYDGAYLFADYVCGKLFALTPNGSGGYVSSTFATDAGAVVAMRFAPYGASRALYYLDYFAGEVRRIAYSNQAPEVTIDAPLPDKQFYVGEQIVLSASGNDPEDGVLPASAFTWRVVRVHDDHTHPYMAPTQGNDIPLVTPGPESLSAAHDSRLDIELTARDAGGRVTKVTQALQPRLVQLTFDTLPGGLNIDVAGKSIVAPLSVTSWLGWQLEVDAYDQAASNDEVWAFAGWSDGGGLRHTIITPAADTTYTASFTRVSAPPRPPPLQADPAATPWTPPKGTGSGSTLRLHLGGNGRDRIVGTRGRDRACGRGGADVISLEGGDDVGYGGECGANSSKAGHVVSVGKRVRDGNDVLRGGAGRDRLYGNGANDLLNGGPGHDSLTGNGGKDRLIGGAGLDRFFGGPGNDVIDSRDGRREIVDCGPGRDRAIADHEDVLRSCELPQPQKKISRN
jgi:glucose/arabinose dehydrogenase